MILNLILYDLTLVNKSVPLVIRILACALMIEYKSQSKGNFGVYPLILLIIYSFP